MNILALGFEDITKPTGGMGVHMYYLYRELGKLGHKIKIITLGTGKNSNGKYNIQDNVEVLKISNTSTYLNRRPFIFQFCMEKNYIANILEIYGRESFDLIHIHDSHLWWVSDTLRAYWQIPIVMTSHLSPLLHELRYAIDDLALYKNQMEGTALVKSDAVITVSNYYKDKLNDFFPGLNPTVIYNGVDYEFLSGIRPDFYIDSLKYKKRQSLVTMVGRAVHSKGIEIFLEAAKRTPDKNFCLISWLCDDTIKHYPLAKAIQKLHDKSKNFRWARKIDYEDKFELMKSSDYGIVPSLYEPFGIVALEWMALSVPLITTGAGGLGEFCSPSNCRLIKPTSNSLTRTLKYYQEDIGRLGLLRARATAKSFSWRKVAKQTVKLYREVLDA